MTEGPDITISRSYFHDCTLSRIFYPGGSLFGLELPWLDNLPDVSCIPEGEYDYEVRESPRTGDLVIWVLNVPNRTAIQWHPGNYTREIRGCGMPGMGIKFLDSDDIPDVFSSGAALEAILEWIPERGTIRYTASTARTTPYVDA